MQGQVWVHVGWSMALLSGICKNLPLFPLLFRNLKLHLPWVRIGQGSPR